MFLYHGVPLIFVILLTSALTSEVHKDVSSTNKDYETISIVLEDNEMEPIVLECEYPDEEEDNVVSVKWYKDNKAMYQWLPGQDPSVLPDFDEEKFDDFKVSKNPLKNSSVDLLEPTIGTSGFYKCVVETVTKAYFTYKRIQVIDVRNYTFDLVPRKIQNETQLECIVYNVFPKPTLYISSDDEDDVNIISETAYEMENGYFNATKLAATYDNDDDPDAYKCMIAFDGYHLNLTTTASPNGVGSLLVSVDFMRLPLVVLVVILCHCFLRY